MVTALRQLAKGQIARLKVSRGEAKLFVALEKS
jgi:hypothetical protein